MAKVVRLFCAYCNPQNLYPPDRRAADSGESAELIAIREQRTGQDRRLSGERRLVDALPPGQPDRRHPTTQGRRQCDGYAWFEGCIDKAIRSKWHVGSKADTLTDADEPATVLCPKCHNKIR
ncbi:MAG: hypothetical protein H7835_04155 [Magnetococcus sp. XQGC-1]